MSFGETLKRIRKNRCLTQLEVCDGIMKQSTYSRIENGQLDISAEHLVRFTERLNISLNEFLYIHQGYKSTPRQKLIIDYMKIELALPEVLSLNQKSVEAYLKKHSDIDIELLSLCYDVLIALSTDNDLQKVQCICNKIWTRLQKLEHWYINDLELLIVIIIYFPFDTAKEITKTALTRLHAYESYEKDLTHLHIYFLINITILYLDQKQYEEALTLLENLQQQYIKHFTYPILGLLIVRKIICKYFLEKTYEEDLLKLRMLNELFEDEEVFEALYEGLVTYGVEFER